MTSGSSALKGTECIVIERRIQKGVSPTEPVLEPVRPASNQRIGDGVEHERDHHRQTCKGGIEAKHLTVVKQQEERQTVANRPVAVPEAAKLRLVVARLAIDIQLRPFCIN